MRISKIAFSLLFPLILIGCSKRNMKSYPAIEACDLVVIEHTANGELIDYLAIPTIKNQKIITAKSRGDASEFFVTVYGTKLHPAMQTDSAVSTNVKEGFLGRIEVILDKGLVVRVMGNGIHTPSPIATATLQKIDANIEQKKFEYLLNPLIIETKTAEQAGAGQPATKSADKAAVKDQSSTPTPKDGPR